MTRALEAEIAACTVCADRFRAAPRPVAPRPVVRLSAVAPVLIAGQAPGRRVHASGLPFDDPSGDRLRDWLRVDRVTFYDRRHFAMLPMGFCFPGQDAGGADLPPPSRCARLWRARALGAMPGCRLILLLGGPAQRWHLGAAAAGGVGATVWAGRACTGPMIALPHPSWRNTGWLRRNPWFEAELLPRLRARIAALVPVLDSPSPAD